MRKLSILVVGSGGREHALVWKLRQSPHVTDLFVAPGNAGTAQIATNVPIGEGNVDALLQFARKHRVGLTVVGPEETLAAGIVDVFSMAGLQIFGPTRRAAQLESSKVFAKEFMMEEKIAMPAFAVFSDYKAARMHVANQPTGVVIKASGLARGKGVMVCDNPEDAKAILYSIMVERQFGTAGEQVVIEERLEGQEASLLAFTDGKTVVPMMAVRDYKRAYDEDHGPNTSGMGAYGPPHYMTDALVQELTRSILRKTIKGMSTRRTPYVGVLYAGLMLTSQGTKVLEFNCRLGDPETQVILPMLEGDLAEIMLACVEGQLSADMMRTRAGACTSVVLASDGYPDHYFKGLPITGIESAAAEKDVIVFHAGTQLQNNQLLTNGGRVLTVTGLGKDVEAATERAYAGIQHIHFEGAQYRKDIGKPIIS